jgi:KDO2-lipid IV(A) lauroyltransferase
VVDRQIAAAFPGIEQAEVDRIARACYSHLGRITAESAVLSKLGKEGVLAMVESAEGVDLLESALASGSGCILVTGHFGNWELAGTYLAARGIPLDVVVRRMQNPLFDEYLNELRLRMGMTVVYDQEAVRRTPRALNAGRAVGFLADQGGKGIAATHVNFFGRPARTPRGPAVFAMRYDVPLLTGAAIRQPSGRYRFVLQREEVRRTGDRDRDVDALVRQYTRTIERWVRLAPEQYFWQHRRWKRQPPETPPELRDPV